MGHVIGDMCFARERDLTKVGVHPLGEGQKEAATAEGRA